MGVGKAKLNIRAINRLMTSQPVTAEVARRAHRIRAAAGDDFEVVVNPHKWTARAYVRATKGGTDPGRLLRAIDAGR